MNSFNSIKRFATTEGVMDCGGKALAATPLSDVLRSLEKRNSLARESGVALRFPPQSMTRLLWFSRSLIGDVHPFFA